MATTTKRIQAGAIVTLQQIKRAEGAQKVWRDAADPFLVYVRK